MQMEFGEVHGAFANVVLCRRITEYSELEGTNKDYRVQLFKGMAPTGIKPTTLG